ncbi:hypothetical protein G6F56_013893 [Rhizopus delemar]|nr:hypothetical protein G6F56_013893 [Rhizopus delemar]
MLCSEVPYTLWLSLPSPPPGFTGHHVDYVLNLLPTKSDSPCPPYWPALCQILFELDKMCHPDNEYSSGAVPGQVWMDKTKPPNQSV